MTFRSRSEQKLTGTDGAIILIASYYYNQHITEHFVILIMTFLLKFLWNSVQKVTDKLQTQTYPTFYLN